MIGAQKGQLNTQFQMQKIKLKNIFTYLISIFISSYAFLWFNLTIMTPFLLGDLHKYDTGDKEITPLFSLFFEISSNTGYVPEPSVFNFILTIVLGSIMGLFVGRKALHP